MIETQTERMERLERSEQLKRLNLDPRVRMAEELRPHLPFTQNLKREDYSGEVFWLQKALCIEKALKEEQCTGHFDHNTEVAVRRFQMTFVKTQPLTGVVDVATRDILNQRMKSYGKSAQRIIKTKMAAQPVQQNPVQRPSRSFPILKVSAIVLAAVLGIKVCTKPDHDETHDPSTPTTEQQTPALQKRIDHLELPSGISDLAAILYIAEPVVERETGLFYDTLIDNYTVAETLFGGQLLLMGVDEEANLPENEKYLKRIYRFTIPSTETGETLRDNKRNIMANVTWADALNAITRVHEITDAEFIKFLQWWYQRTFQIDLNPALIKITRTKDGRIENITYQTAEPPMLRYNALRIIDDIPATSRQSNRTTDTVAKPLTARDGRLLAWTGIKQDLAIPEDFLQNNWRIHMSLGQYGEIVYTMKELRESMERYLTARDLPANERMVTYKNTKGEMETIEGWAHFVTSNDPIIKRIVDKVTAGAKNEYERLERLRLFAQSTVKYRWEAGIDVNRPAIATLLQGWGDCNNLAIYMATLFKTAGFDVAMVFMDKTEEQEKTLRSNGELDNYFSAHLALAVRESDLAASGRDFQSWGYANQPRWVIIEATGKSGFGEEDYTSEAWNLTPVLIQEVQ